MSESPVVPVPVCVLGVVLTDGFPNVDNTHTCRESG